jgi:predicted DNA-binding transcriptional regulator AlpA
MPVESADALLLSAADVSRRLAICKGHLHGLRRAGKFPLTPIRLGRAVRFSADELTRWTQAGCPAADRWRLIQQAEADRGRRATG